MKVLIDPGHGGKDPGAVNGDLHEADIVLKIAKKVVNKLSQYDNVQTKLSRSTDVFLELKERTDIANSWGADVLISIHINSATNKNANGIETLIYTNGSNESLVIASSVQSQLIREANRNNRGVKKANFHMLRESKMPACLVECGFISNAIESSLMKTDKFLEQCANAIVKGIVEVYKLNLKKEVVKVANRPLTDREKEIQAEAMELGITDGKNPFEPVDRFYLWSAMIPLAKRVRALEEKKK
ncbi:N-acetylmuramoyl-L-alanine amidase family protein [Metabacillus litoralis]|uniref:N-acetylmuramoyl-L-alanine amidase family protein n=1 Tax=Metabacillus litoralis TaxID=152268 RepID=UPI00203D2BD2|nr:N-acetylmuramoyl-L-alanine amidase [Metabacillus litoralis]MCM3413504.1 N-acetylmuramoyl-L-alanine amidase [Metabacillus litoralis]